MAASLSLSPPLPAMSTPPPAMPSSPAPPPAPSAPSSPPSPSPASSSPLSTTSSASAPPPPPNPHQRQPVAARARAPRTSDRAVRRLARRSGLSRRATLAVIVRVARRGDKERQPTPCINAYAHRAHGDPAGTRTLEVDDNLPSNGRDVWFAALCNVTESSPQTGAPAADARAPVTACQSSGQSAPSGQWRRSTCCAGGAVSTLGAQRAVPVACELAHLMPYVVAMK